MHDLDAHIRARERHASATATVLLLLPVIGLLVMLAVFVRGQ